MTKPALLALANGKIFTGLAIGAEGTAVGEVVFNTAMTGYQEIISDPSYAEQIVTLTYPHIGNVGCNPQDNESNSVFAKGLVIRDLCESYSNWRGEESLNNYLKRHKLVGIAEVDTRALTHCLRESGAQGGCITTVLDAQAAITKAKAFVGLNNTDLAKVVSTPEAYTLLPEGEAAHHVVVYDFGVKRNILKHLLKRDCQLTVVPAQTPAEDVIAMKPQAVLLSNGPGDPSACDYAIAATKTLLNARIPLMGICLGHQILGLALNAKTLKMKFGHHGANHPVQAANQQVCITSQNHGFAIDESSLPPSVEVTHRSLFDNSLQGIAHKEQPAFGFQGHPEASPGPHDVTGLFDEFIQSMR